MEDSRNYVSIGDQEILVTRLKFREWLRLEEIHADIFDAVEAKSGEKLIFLIYSYVSTASFISVDELKECPWYEITRAYLSFYKTNVPLLDFPFLRKRVKKRLEIETEEGWNYKGRNWYMWAHMLAQRYGWSLEYIAKMDIDDALALIQEIEINEQLDREWQWGLSEKSVSYDSNTKTAKFVPLDRPEWMQATRVVKDLPKFRMKRSNLPVGLVLSWDDDKSKQPQ